MNDPKNIYIPFRYYLETKKVYMEINKREKAKASSPLFRN